MSTYWTVQREADSTGPKIRLIIGNAEYEMSLRLPAAQVSQVGGREKVNAWLLAVVTIPGINVEFAEAERFLDWLDEHFPIPPSGLRRPRFRLF